MPSFQKPQPSKAALKLGMYGPAGSGKTFTSLLIAEGLARHTGKRVAYCDTEFGTAFYGQQVAQRAAHPDAFDFDVLHTKSITEVLAALKQLDPGHHGVVVVDSITHLWDACRNAYTGRQTKAGTIPLHAWSLIKRPYKEMVHWLLASPLHVLICGRQGIDYGEDEATGELKSLGYRMRAEGETAYEPDVLLRLESHRPAKYKPAIPVAHVEKDRTGVLAGQTIAWPTFDNVAKPLLGLLGTKQAAQQTDDEVGQQDAEALARQELEREQHSVEMAAQFTARFGQADGIAALERVGKELTAAVKGQLAGADLARVRKAYAVRLGQLKAEDRGAVSADGPAGTAAANGAGAEP
jgi:hypothetical protein